MTITLTREEAQQVLDAVTNTFVFVATMSVVDERAKAVETLRARLAQPEPQHVEIKGLKSALHAIAAVAEKHKGASWRIVEDAANFAINDSNHNEIILQKPVAWRSPNWGHSDADYIYRDLDDPALTIDGKVSPHNEPLYTVPPQREWVGLTDEERSEILLDFLCDPSTEHIRDIEAKLKEKNHGV